MALAYSSVERRGSSRRAQAVHRGCGQGAHRASWSRLCNFKVQTWWPIGATRPRQRPSGLPWSWQPAVRACGGMGSRFAKSEQSCVYQACNKPRTAERAVTRRPGAREPNRELSRLRARPGLRSHTQHTRDSAIRETSLKPYTGEGRAFTRAHSMPGGGAVKLAGLQDSALSHEESSLCSSVGSRT